MMGCLPGFHRKYVKLTYKGLRGQTVTVLGCRHCSWTHTEGL